MAFNSKNLHYEKNEPAFLRKLRGEYGSDMQIFQAARPKRDRLTNDDDDAPTMVDEEGASVSKEDYEAMIKGKDSEEESAKVSEKVDSETSKHKEGLKDDVVLHDASNEKQKFAEVGVAKKRKQVKVVGDEAGEDESAEKQKPKPTKKPKKKMKLSFDEPEG